MLSYREEAFSVLTTIAVSVRLVCLDLDSFSIIVQRAKPRPYHREEPLCSRRSGVRGCCTGRSFTLSVEAAETNTRPTLHHRRRFCSILIPPIAGGFSATLSFLGEFLCPFFGHTDSGPLVILPMLSDVVLNYVSVRYQDSLHLALLTAKGSSGFGAPSRAWIDRRTVRICKAGDHLFFKISRQILPSLSEEPYQGVTAKALPEKPKSNTYRCWDGRSLSRTALLGEPSDSLLARRVRP